MKKRMLSLLCSLALLVTMLPVTALAGGDNSFTFESLATALQNESGTGIYFKPDADFVWPVDGGTLTFKQNLYLEGDWEIPANVTLEFPKSGCGIANSNASEIHTVTINGPVQVTAPSHDQFISRCNVVLKPGSSIQLAYDTASLYIGKDCTWTVEAGATLTPWVRLDGTLTGEGTVSGQVNVQGGFNGSSSNGVLSGSLTLTGGVQVGNAAIGSAHQDTLTIPAGSAIQTAFAGSNAIHVDHGTLVLDGSLDINGSKSSRTTGLGLNDGCTLQLGQDAELSFHYPYELTCTNPEAPQTPYVTGTGTIQYYADDVGNIDRYCLFSRDLTGKDMPFETAKEGLIPAYMESGVAIWCSWNSGHEHSWGAWQTVTDATCTTEGLEERACQDAGCSAKETRPIPARGHALTYSKSGDTITQSCKRPGCTHSADARLFVNNMTYTGLQITASISYDKNWWGALPSLRYEGSNVNAGSGTVYATADDTEIYLAYTIYPATEYTVSLGNLSQYSDSVSAVTWTTNPPDKTATAAVEYQITTPEKPCTHVHDESCGANGENCQHQHDTTCGYAAAKTEWTTTLPTAVGSYPVRVKLTDSQNLVLKTGEDAYTTGTLTISARPSSGGSSGSGSSGNKTETTTNPDGSTTTIVTRPDGSTTETTKNPDGSTEVVDTKKDGTVITTTTDKDGNKTVVTENTDGTTETIITNTNGTTSSTKTDADGKTETVVKLPASVVADAADAGEAVVLPMPKVAATSDSASAPTVTVDLSGSQSAKVEIPVSGVMPGTVAVIVGEDGDEQIILTSIPTENGVAVTLADGDTVKVIDNSKDFADVPYGYWGAGAVDFVTSRELFNGTSNTAFTPDGAMTRAMIVTVLARYEGVDTSTGDNWYDAGRDWAMEAGISDGTDMDGTLTREQLATMLYRYAQSKGQGFTGAWAFRLDYPDADAVSDYAYEAMRWTTMHGIINGMGDGSLAPQGQATRAQVATMLMRFVTTVE